MNRELTLLLQDDNITHKYLKNKGYSIDDIAELANIASLVNR